MEALFSACGRYRYRLDRTIGMFGRPVGFLLHNPSVANQAADDPTSRRGIGFAHSWGNNRLIFVNVWAAVATKPRDLWAIDDPIGPDNDYFIRQVATEIAGEGGYFVIAHGKISPPSDVKKSAFARVSHVMDLLEKVGCDLRCLATNKDGSPKHPLYVPYGGAPLPYWRQLLDIHGNRHDAT